MKLKLKALATAIIQTAAERQPADMPQLAEAVAQVLSERGQFRLMRALGPYLEAAYNEQKGILPVTVATATEQDPEELRQLTDALKKTLGKELDVRTDVRPELIGGMRVRFGDDDFDFSLSSELRAASAHLSSSNS